MAHDIDKFWFNPDNRSDWEANAKLLNIVFNGGTFGNFLKYFIERFSNKTPEIVGDPFTKTGTSHVLKDEEYSGLVQQYHGSFINENQDQTNLPVCIIVPTRQKHYLYLKQAQLFRADDDHISPDDLWRKAVGEMPDRIKSHAAKIKELYGIKETAHFHWLPKFIVRDWYKLEFLQKLEDTHDYKWFETFKTHPFFKKQKTYQLDLESFFCLDLFLQAMAELDDVFKLDLDFDRMREMESLFNQGLEMDSIRQECNLAENVLENDLEVDFRNLSVTTEAYIYAHYEKQFKDIQMPLTNRFFRDKQEIDQFLEYFPAWYKKINPNLG